MAISLAIFLLILLLSVNAAPPAVQISNGEIQPLGTATACSTITTTIGTRVDYIPVPCSALPPVFTEEVIVNGTSVSLVIGPSGDVNFKSEPWLAQPTSLVMPNSQSASHLSSRTARSSIPSQTGSQISKVQMTNSSYTSAPSGSLSSRTQSQTSSSPIKISNSTGAAGSLFFKKSTVSPSSAVIFGIATSTGTSARPSSNGALGSLSSSVSSGNASASNVQTIASSSTATSEPCLSPAVSQSLAGESPSIRSHSLPVGSVSSQSFGPQAVNSTRTSAEISLFTQSRSPESLSPGSSRAWLTVSPASLTISIPSSTTTSRAVTSGLGGTSPGFPLSAFVPIATPITSLDPIGPVVKSSVSAVQSSISIIIPVVQSYIDKPTCKSCSTDAVNALKGVLPTIEDLSDSIGPGPSPHPCSASLNLLSDISNAAKCAAQNVENAISHIKGGQDDINDLKSDVKNLNDLQKPLENDDEEDDDKSQSEPSQSQSNPTQSQSSASKASASQLSTMTSLTASKISLSASSGSSTTVSSSTGSCALPPVVTLPPDSLTGPSQPDQPTSVVVTGLPTSVTRSSNTSTTGSTMIMGTSATGFPTSTTGSFDTITTGPTMGGRTGTIGLSASPNPKSSYSCYPFADPDAGPAGPQCQCDGLDGFYPYLSSTTGQTKYNPCGYTTSPTKASATSVPGFTTTESDGDVVSCASSTYYNFAVDENPSCAGSTQIVSTVASIASVYSASVASAGSLVSVASVSSASVAAWSAAAAIPSAACWILHDDGFGDSTFEVYGINGWAGDGGSKLWHQEKGCGILSGKKFNTDGQSVFEGQLRNTQNAYFGLSFFKGGCVERAVHSAGGPPPGNGPNHIKCRHVPSSLSSHQLNAVKSIAGPQLKAVQAVADGTSTTGNLVNIVEDDVVQPGESSSAGTGGSQPNAALVASASAALPHLLASASGASTASKPTTTSGLALL